MIVKATALAGALRTLSIPAVCVIEGEEDELRTRAQASIMKWVLGDEADAVFNCDVYYADEHGASTILNSALELPVFASRRMVVIRRAEKIGARDSEAWLGYLADPNVAATVVLVATKFDKRLKLSQALLKQPMIVDCSPLPDAALSTWIREEAGQLGVRLTEDAVCALREAGGQSLAMVRRELEKLALVTPHADSAGAAQVEALRGVEPGASVFDLTAAIGARDRRQALTILARNLEAGEAPLRVLGALVWQYRRLWKMKEVLAQGRRDGEVARTLRIDPYKVRSFLGRFTEPHMRRAFELFLDSDSKLKGASAGSGRKVLETVLLSLCEA